MEYLMLAHGQLFFTAEGRRRGGIELARNNNHLINAYCLLSIAYCLPNLRDVYCLPLRLCVSAVKMLPQFRFFLMVGTIAQKSDRIIILFFLL